MRLAVVVAAGFCLAGCVSSSVSRADSDANKQAFSREAYEAAMRESGRGADLEREKRLAGERRTQERNAVGPN